MSNVAVAILWDRFQAQGSVVFRHGAGRPRATTNPDDRLIVLQARCHRFINVTPSRRRFRWLHELGFSTLTYWNSLLDGDIWARQTANLIPMTHGHIQTHLQ